MATPEYVPQSGLVGARVTDFPSVPPPRRLPPRPAEMLTPPAEPGFGVPCPDAGYGYLLGHELDDRLETGPDEAREDAHWAVATVGVRRAGRAGRAPDIDDLAVSLAVLGYDGSAPEWFVGWRTIRLQGISGNTDLSQWLADTTEEGVGVGDVPPRDELVRWWTRLVATVGPTPVDLPEPDPEQA
jgi:hypothetical protein